MLNHRPSKESQAQNVRLQRSKSISTFMIVAELPPVTTPLSTISPPWQVMIAAFVSIAVARIRLDPTRGMSLSLISLLIDWMKEFWYEDVVNRVEGAFYSTFSFCNHNSEQLFLVRWSTQRERNKSCFSEITRRGLRKIFILNLCF